MRYLILLFALAGIVVSSLSLKVHYDRPGKEPCSLNDKWDCGEVNHSSFAVFYGVPVADIGIAGYLLLGVLALARRKALLLTCAVIGLVFTIHLSDIEAYALGVWCLYCVISQFIIAIVALLSLIWTAWPRLRAGAA